MSNASSTKTNRARATGGLFWLTIAIAPLFAQPKPVLEVRFYFESMGPVAHPAIPSNGDPVNYRLFQQKLAEDLATYLAGRRATNLLFDWVGFDASHPKADRNALIVTAKQLNSEMVQILARAESSIRRGRYSTRSMPDKPIGKPDDMFGIRTERQWWSKVEPKFAEAIDGTQFQRLLDQAIIYGQKAMWVENGPVLPIDAARGVPLTVKYLISDHDEDREYYCGSGNGPYSQPVTGFSYTPLRIRFQAMPPLKCVNRRFGDDNWFYLHVGDKIR